ncbi:MAG: hypothetical protein HYY84_15650 [Deltaproteobacteria bacterium]|nr:hypothetical protein [Deltaproteobacteria bacterium]
MIASGLLVALVIASPSEPVRGVLVDRVVALVAGAPIFLSELREEAVLARAIGEPPCAKEVTPTGGCWSTLLEAVITQRLIDEEARRLQIALGPVPPAAAALKRIVVALGGADALRSFQNRFSREEKELVDWLRRSLRAAKMKAEQGGRVKRWLRDLSARIPVSRLVDLAKDPP